MDDDHECQAIRMAEFIGGRDMGCFESYMEFREEVEKVKIEDKGRHDLMEKQKENLSEQGRLQRIPKNPFNRYLYILLLLYNVA